ncbi:MAG TPA: aspartate-semialdehyde dehydrogenase [Verrucomicrobiae bacterium]|nr:aspartate-semialdehyde dehydrogenase [Verrucomicrobiae bacterium]
MNPLKVAVLGITGAVGQEFLTLLDERKFPVAELRLLASARSAGQKVKFRGETLTIQEAKADSFNGIDVVLSSAGGSVSKQLAPAAVKAGALVVDNTSAFRMDPEVPLVVPEINPEDIAKHKGIIANPNCSTIIMLVPVNPLRQIAKIKKMVVSTYQSASGAGAKAMMELETQSREILEGKKPTKNVFPHQIAFNLFSHNSAVDVETGFNEEETKMMKETAKIFHEAVPVIPTCVRVPVMRAHSESIWVEFDREVSLKEVQQALEKAPGLRLVDDRKANLFPMPIDASGKDDILVGRLRKDPSNPKAISLFVSGDQLRKGAALNAVQIAEIAFQTKLQPAKR